MRIDPRCIPCQFRQAIRAARLAGITDPVWTNTALQEVAAYIGRANLEQNPSAVGSEVHRIMRKALSNPDPFRIVKHRDTQMALKMLEGLRQRVDRAADPVLEALRISAAGNVMDFGLPNDPDHEAQLQIAMEMKFPTEHYPRFLDDLKKISNILLLADNAGELVFDRVLLEVLKKKGLNLVVAVKEGPVLNDATADDAYSSGVHNVAGIMTTGSDDVGVDMSRASVAFKRRLEAADMVIAKGQGHYETLYGATGKIWRLFVVKCDVVAEAVKANVGDIVFFDKDPGK